MFVCTPSPCRSSNDDEGRVAGQFWTTLEKFPQPKMTPYYLHSDGSASLQSPDVETSNSTSYVYDPNNVITTNGGNNLFSDAPCGKDPDVIV